MIPTAYEAKKWVLINAMHSVISGYAPPATAIRGKSALLLPGEWFSSLSHTKKEAFTDAANDLLRDNDLNSAMNSAIRSITHEFAQGIAEQNRLDEIVQHVESRWKRLSVGTLQVQELQHFLIMIRATEDGMSVRMWQALAAFLCRRELSDAAKLSYIFPSTVINAMAHHLSTVFAARLSAELSCLLRENRSIHVQQHIDRLTRALRPEKTPLAVGAMPAFPAFGGKVTTTSLSLLLTFASQYEAVLVTL